METPNYRKASIYFDDETVLEVEQRGGGGSGVGGDSGLAAVNLITGESTNAALAEKDETIEAQAATIEEQAGTIEQQAGEISDLEDEVAAKQAIIDAFPAIEALNVTANGTYSEEGKAYKPVNVDVPVGFVPHGIVSININGSGFGPFAIIENTGPNSYRVSCSNDKCVLLSSKNGITTYLVSCSAPVTNLVVNTPVTGVTVSLQTAYIISVRIAERAIGTGTITLS